MTSKRKTESLLAGLHAPGAAPGQQHRDQLEAELLGEYDRRYARPTVTHRLRWVPVLAAATLLVGLFAASRAPAEYGEDLGVRVEVRPPAGVPLPRGAELARVLDTGFGPSLTKGPRHREINVRALQGPGGPVLLLDVWDNGRKQDLAALLRERVPSLAGAELRVVPLKGRVRTNLAGLLGHRVLRIRNADALDAARRALQAEIAKDGTGSTVEVEVEETQLGRRRVFVKVRRAQ